MTVDMKRKREASCPSLHRGVLHVTGVASMLFALGLSGPEQPSFSHKAMPEAASVAMHELPGYRLNSS